MPFQGRTRFRHVKNALLKFVENVDARLGIDLLKLPLIVMFLPLDLVHLRDGLQNLLRGQQSGAPRFGQMRCHGK